MRVRVTRAFLIKGERQEVGKELDVVDFVGGELISTGKAERVGASPPVSGPMTTESVPAVVEGKAKAAPARKTVKE